MPISIMDFDVSAQGHDVVAFQRREEPWDVSYACNRKARPIRLEWPDDADVLGMDASAISRRLASDASDAPEPAAWVDVISQGEQGPVRLRLMLGADGEQVVTTLEAPSGITMRRLRQMGYGSLMDEFERVLTLAPVRRLLGSAWSREVRRPGRGGRSDLVYAEWAARYTRALESGPGATRQLVREEQQAGRHATLAQVRAYLNRARARGLLTKAPKGREGGRLTPKATRLLKSAGMEI